MKVPSPAWRVITACAAAVVVVVGLDLRDGPAKAGPYTPIAAQPARDGPAKAGPYTTIAAQPARDDSAKAGPYTTIAAQPARDGSAKAGPYMPRHLLKPCSGKMKQVFAGEALEAVLAAAQRPPSNEDSRTGRSALLGGLRRSFVTRQSLVHSLVLSLSKDERFCSWFDELTTRG